MKTFIYALVDPVTDHVRYIGKSNNPKKRFSGHVVDKIRTHKTGWIKSLKKQNLLPVLEILDCVPKSEWELWETHYIGLYRGWGFNLTNNTLGGYGREGFIVSDETKEKMSKCKIGKKHSQETIDKLRILSTGRFQSEETKERNRQSQLGRKMPLEAILKTAAANRGRKNTEEMKQKQSEMFKGKKLNPEHVAKRAKAQMKPVLQFDLNGNFIKEYPSGIVARMEISPYNNSLSGCLKGKLKTWCGYKWKYKETTTNN